MSPSSVMVESVGALPPDVLMAEAIKLLLKKCRDVTVAVENLKVKIARVKAEAEAKSREGLHINPGVSDRGGAKGKVSKSQSSSRTGK